MNSQTRKGPICHIAVVMLVAAALLAGCGSSAPPQSNDQQIRDVVNHFTVDVGQHSYAPACKLTTGQMKSVCAGLNAVGGVAAECKGVSANSALGSACANAQGGPAALSTLTGLVISKLVISGSSATVAFNGSSEVMTLSKQSGKWLIATA